MSGFLAYLFSIIFILPYALFVVVPAIFLFAIFISFLVSNIKTGKKNNWPKKNITGTAIFGALLALTTITFLIATFYFFTGIPYPTSVKDPNAPDSAAMIKNIIFFIDR